MKKLISIILIAVMLTVALSGTVSAVKYRMPDHLDYSRIALDSKDSDIFFIGDPISVSIMDINPDLMLETVSATYSLTLNGVTETVTAPGTKITLTLTEPGRYNIKLASIHASAGEDHPGYKAGEADIHTAYCAEVYFTVREKGSVVPDDPSAKFYKYTVRDDCTACLNGYSGTEENVTVPTRIDGYAVTAIDWGCFRKNELIRSVVIPEGITEIGESAFSGCTSLEKVTLPKSLRMIGNGAFRSCPSLKSITLPSGLDYFGDNVFDGSTLERITVSGKDGNFMAKDGCLIDKREGRLEFVLKGFKIPAGGIVTTIGRDFLTWTNRLDDITIPEGVTWIEDGAFCAISIGTIRLPRTLIGIEGEAFGLCDYGDGDDSDDPIEKVVYNGTKEMWDNVSVAGMHYEARLDIGSVGYPSNKPILDAKKYVFLSEDKLYSDIPESAWYHDEVMSAVNGLVMTGTSNDTFSPNATMTRAMLTTILWRLESGCTWRWFNELPYRDVKYTWYTQALRWANHCKIVNGTSETKFSPNGSITREQLATMLYRYAGYKKLDTSKQAELTKFADAKKVSSYAETAVKWAVAEEIIKGVEKNGSVCLDPQGSATRAQVATMLQRFCETG